MNTLAHFFNPFAHAHNHHGHNALYDVVENETIKGKDFSELTLSGSLFSLTVFRDVTFESCVFFATRMENCTFVNCKFKNCSFQFSTVEHCQFGETEFQDCLWDVTPIKQNTFDMCLLCDKTAYFASKSELKNRITGSVRRSGPVQTEQDPEIASLYRGIGDEDQDSPGTGQGLTEEAPYLPPLPTEDDGPTKTVAHPTPPDGGIKAA